ncbi:MAG: alpha-glucosidase C-terminal domain-containing protein [Gelidibacter sp.]|nr:alpha-glucosidase C-terminal domain-containing protein [Gelidibacter sp.]
MGITSILLTPLYDSSFYHNYFADDFETIDAEYGTLKDYLSLVKAIHKRGMKIYQDVEMQYVSGHHKWFTQSYQNPKSQYSDYILYADSSNTQPIWFWNVPEFTIHDGSKQKIIMVNMKSDAVKKYTETMLKFWMDPNNDGDFSDGVDGFRLDHMMDNLDNIGLLTNLFETFWNPLLTDLKAENPKLKIIAEQANWASFGHDYFTKTPVDDVFGFRLKFAINSFKKEDIIKVADSTLRYNPKGKQQILFLENHDTNRFASEDGMTIEKNKAAAAIQLLMGNLPLIYYGQELGMQGQKIDFGNVDGNDILVREAFEWDAADDESNLALWYKNTGPWWQKSYIKAFDGISYEEEKQDKNSLWHFYKTLLKLRKQHTAFQNGMYENILNANDKVLSFKRSNVDESIMVFVNLSNEMQRCNVKLSDTVNAKSIYGKTKFQINTNNLSLKLAPFAVEVLKL